MPLNKFSIILNSANKVDGTNNNANFQFDFSQFEQCLYQVFFNFSGVPGTLTNSTEPPILQIGLSQNNIFKIGGQTTNTIGPLYMLWSSNKTLITGTSTDTLQTLILTLPQNQITIRLVTYDEKTLWLDANGNDLLKYILIMTFEKVLPS